MRAASLTIVHDDYFTHYSWMIWPTSHSIKRGMNAKLLKSYWPPRLSFRLTDHERLGTHSWLVALITNVKLLSATSHTHPVIGERILPSANRFGKSDPYCDPNLILPPRLAIPSPLTTWSKSSPRILSNPAEMHGVEQRHNASPTDRRTCPRAQRVSTCYVLCAMCYVLCAMCYVLCAMCYVLCAMCYVLLCFAIFSIICQHANHVCPPAPQPCSVSSF